MVISENLFLKKNLMALVHSFFAGLHKLLEDFANSQLFFIFWCVKSFKSSDLVCVLGILPA
jgi:hypothetical protein